MLKDVVKVAEKSEQRAYVFPPLVCKRAVYESEIAPENESVGVKDINSVFVEFWHLFVFSAEHKVCKDAQYEGTGNGSDLNFAETDYHSAYASDEDYACNEKISVFVQINLLEHLES